MGCHLRRKRKQFERRKRHSIDSQFFKSCKNTYQYLMTGKSFTDYENKQHLIIKNFRGEFLQEDFLAEFTYANERHEEKF